jgi:hypothetical protein
MIADLSMPQKSQIPKRQYKGECHDYLRNQLQQTRQRIR